jgi:chromosome segregation ATPase
MPRVNRIRVSNIKLDGGTKVIGDKIWEQNGLSTIFLLENGGGKTSIIQLLHQVILPNHAIQGRALKSIVEKGSTINVAVEWIPDSENQPMFVTGFCFFHHGIKKENSTSTYDYFNYILERDTEDSLSLEKIPFILAGKITPYSELQSFLKQDENTQVFAQNYTYQEALEQYGILASEWQNISKVNGAEAGVTAFFDKADKIQTLIEKLLLPAFLDNLFTTDEERNAIVQAFKTYKDRLLELPALERDLIDFEAVTNNADVIIDTTKRYSELKTALENVRIQMTRLFYSLQYEKENNVDLLNELEKQLQDIEILKEELQWKIDSYKVHLYKIEEMEASARFKEAEIKKKQVTDLVKSLEQKVNEQSAAESYEDYKRYSGELNRLEAQIKTAELDADEKMQELKISLDRVSSGNRFLLSKLTEQENVSNQNIAGLTHEKDNNEHALRETQNLMTDVKVEIGKLENSITQHDQEITEISDALGDFKHKTIQESEEAVTSHILNLQAIMQKNKDALEEFDLQSKQVQGEIQQEIKNEENLKRELEETEQHFEEFSEEEHELKNDIAANSPLAVRTELFDQQEEIRSALRRKKEALNQEILQEAVMLEQYNQYYKQIDQKGYHLHPEIESVKRYLQARDIYVISGTEWLLKSTFPKEKKQEIFMKNPLLPFSLLIEKDKLKKTSALLGAFKEELTVPVFFLMKQGLEDEDVQGNFTEITNNTHLFQKFKVRFTEVEWNNWANELEEKIRGLQEKQQELKSKEQKTIESDRRNQRERILGPGEN